MKRPDKIYFKKLPESMPKAAYKFIVESYKKIGDKDEGYIRIETVLNELDLVSSKLREARYSYQHNPTMKQIVNAKLRAIKSIKDRIAKI